MAEQSRLEQEGLNIRKELLTKNDFNRTTDVYSEEHDKSKTHNDELHPLGKGTGHGGHTHTVPNRKLSKTAIDRSQFDTENGGGSYDIYGYNNAGGRTRLLSINLYNANKQYNENSIDTTSNIEDGQWVNNN